MLAPPPGTTITKYPKVEPKKNGIRDLCLSLFGLREAKIKQVTVNCQTDKGATSWRLDTTDSQDWPLVIRRPGTDISADLFLEPPPGDCHQKNFTIMIQYEDGQAGNTNAMVQDHHTDPKLAIDPKTPAVPLVDAWLYLTGDEKLFGKLESIGQETLRLTTPWQDHLEVPLLACRRDSSRHAGSQGIDRIVRQTAENARIGRPAAGSDEKRRGHRDPRHLRRRRQRETPIQLSEPHADDAAHARWKA